MAYEKMRDKRVWTIEYRDAGTKHEWTEFLGAKLLKARKPTRILDSHDRSEVQDKRVEYEDGTVAGTRAPLGAMRWSWAEVQAFEDELSFEDVWGAQWRARMVAPFGNDVCTLVCRDWSVDTRTCRLRVAHPPGEPLPPVGWDAMLMQMGVV